MIFLLKNNDVSSSPLSFNISFSCWHGLDGLTENWQTGNCARLQSHRTKFLKLDILPNTNHTKSVVDAFSVPPCRGTGCTNIWMVCFMCHQHRGQSGRTGINLVPMVLFMYQQHRNHSSRTSFDKQQHKLIKQKKLYPLLLPYFC